MIIYYVRTTMLGREITLPKLAVIGGWFLFGAALTILLQVVRKKEFGWAMSFIGTTGFGLLVAFGMLLLKKAGLIYQ